MSGYVALVWLHVFAATVWIGSMAFFAAVVVPALRTKTLRENAMSLITILAPRFRILGLASLGALLVTGVVLLGYHGIGWAEVTHGGPWTASNFGRTLLHKLALVGVVLVVSVVHEIIGARNRRAASWIGRIMMLASLGILYYAVLLVRGL
jgi:uncharacterized membrane protein